MSEKEMPILFVLMRTDMASMNPGKAMAQACHAANQMTYFVNSGTCTTISTDDPLLVMKTEWEKQALGFGTTIVLDGKSESNIRDIIDRLTVESWDSGDVLYGVVHDPSYPIRDGAVTHFLPIDTCGWVFCRKGSRYHKMLEGLELHP